MARLIMVADETKEILELYQAILTDAGYEVSLPSVHTDLFEKVKRLKPVLLILDLIFSKQLVGWEIVKQLGKRVLSWLSTSSKLFLRWIALVAKTALRGWFQPLKARRRGQLG